MSLNIKNLKVEALATEVAEMTGETKTEAIRKALEERKQRISLRLTPGSQRRQLLEFLEEEVWPVVPTEALGKRLTREEEESILGFGSEDV